MRRHEVVIGVVWLSFLLAGCGGGPGSAPEEARPDLTPPPTSAAPATATPPSTTLPSSQETTSTMSPPLSGDPAGSGETVPSMPPTTSAGVESGLAPFVSAAVADLASRLGIGEGEVSVVSAEMLVWPDGALGCPEPGMEYRQVQVDGFKIVLAARGAEFAYHGGGSRGPFLCEGSVG